MTNNEIACYLSHLKAYEALIASREEAALILEDDISCDMRLTHVLNSLNASEPTKWSVLRLQSTKTSVAEPTSKADYGEAIEDIAGHSICRLKTNVLGGCGYVIRREAALTLLTRSRRIFMPIDQMMDRYWENGIAPYVVRPLPVWHEGAFPSEIGERGRALAEPLRGIDLIARRAQRLVDSLNKRLFWLTYSPQGTTALPRLSVGRLSAAAAAMLLAATAIEIATQRAAEAGPEGDARAGVLTPSPPTPARNDPTAIIEAARREAQPGPAAVGIVETKTNARRIQCAPQSAVDVAHQGRLRPEGTIPPPSWLPDDKAPVCHLELAGRDGKGGHRQRWRRLRRAGLAPADSKPNALP